MDKAYHPFMIAVQFHPERLGKENPIHLQMRKVFIKLLDIKKKLDFLIFISKSTNFADRFVRND